MTAFQYDMTGRDALQQASVAEVFPKKKLAYIVVPNRASIKINHAIGYCWIQSRSLMKIARIDASDDEVIVVFDLSVEPFNLVEKEKLDEWIGRFCFELADWVHQTFFDHLRDNSHVFWGDQ
ncbi:hypothetical protein OAU68_00575 [Litorivicinus sp.]|nr:hypothetical protein [Litorivicinus sp.]